MLKRENLVKNVEKNCFAFVSCQTKSENSSNIELNNLIKKEEIQVIEERDIEDSEQANEESVNEEEEEEEEYVEDSEQVKEWIKTFDILPLDYKKEVANAISDVKNVSTNRYNFMSVDASQLNLSDFNYTKDNFRYNTATTWPENLKKDFNPESLIEEMKDPGLGIRNLHAEGITGKGVNVAFVDVKLLVNHESFRDNLVYYEEIDSEPGEVHFHGTTILSLLAGKDTGVAPDVNVYAFAYNINSERDYKLQLADAILKVVDIDKTLDNEKKIKVISLSSGWMPDESEELNILLDAIDLATKDDILVFTASIGSTHNYFIGGVERTWREDVNDISTYYIAKKIQVNPAAKKDDLHILVPWYGITTAGATNPKAYSLYGSGAYSPAIPFYTGLYALGLQIDSTLTMNEFWQYLTDTSHVLEENRNLVNPEKFIEMVKNNK